jgi:transposase
VAIAEKDFSQEDKRPVKLFFQDEARFGRLSDPAYCWAPSGLRPIVSSQIVREFTHVFSAVSPNDGRSFSLILPYADTEAMNIFLQEFSEAFQEYRIILVMDKAAWHRSKDLSMVDNIRYIYQPPYSPELNPVEHLWEYIRENYFKNAYWPSMATLEEALSATLKKITDCSEMIRSLVGFHWAII